MGEGDAMGNWGTWKAAWFTGVLMNAMTLRENTAPDELPACTTYIKGTTLITQRIEYANLWHTINDWFNVHWTLEFLNNPTDLTIIWLDGHAKGQLDDVWGQLFNAKVMYHLRPISFPTVIQQYYERTVIYHTNCQ
jgi:hypothetical protein